MPQDPTNIYYQTGDTVSHPLADSLHATSGHQLTHTLISETQKIEDTQDALWPALLIIASFVAFLLPTFRTWVLQKTRSRRAKRLYEVRAAEYDKLLQQYIPYYRNLSPAYRERFLQRTLLFKEAKEFRFVEIEPEERIPLLISAAAVQLTFGLEHYLLDYFTTIHVLRNVYKYGEYNTPFEGHVSADGIYFAWNRFIKAFDNYNDGENVGLHEMAHALAYVNFTADDGSDEAFKERFRTFSKTGRRIFAEIQTTTYHFLGTYAATNYQEFWAVCVEKFFEQTLAFKIQLPELYAAMCILLNQDPLSADVLLTKLTEEA